MGEVGLRSGFKTAFWIGLACVTTYITYAYWKRSKHGSIIKDFERTHKIKFIDKIPKNILLVGLKNSGKTSLINQIFIANQHDMNQPVQPKLFESITDLENDLYRYNIHEVANVEEIPRWTFWHMFREDLIIFVIDSLDVNKIPLAYKLLKDVIYDPQIKETPILIVANKQDHSHALTPEQVKKALNLPNILVSRHKIEVIGCQTKPLPDLIKEEYESQYHSSVIAVKNKIFSMTA